MFENFFRNFFSHQISRFSSSDLHSNIFAEVFEVVCLSNEVCFAVYFYEYANTAVAMDIRIYETFSSDTGCFFSSGSEALFTQVVYCFVHITVDGSQCFFAIHHASASFCSQIFYHACCNSHYKFLLKLTVLYNKVFNSLFHWARLYGPIV